MKDIIVYAVGVYVKVDEGWWDDDGYIRVFYDHDEAMTFAAKYTKPDKYFYIRHMPEFTAKVGGLLGLPND